MKHPPRDWRKLGEFRKVVKHNAEGGGYRAVAVSNEGLLAVTDGANKCVHLLTKNSRCGVLVRSIGKGLLGDLLYGVAFDQKGRVWVTDIRNNKVVKLSQDGQLLQAIHHAGSESDCFNFPRGIAVSPEGLIYICDYGNNRITIHDEEGQFLRVFGTFGSDPECFRGPHDIAFGSDGLVYVTDAGNKRVCAWSKEGTFKRNFNPKYASTFISATSDNHLLITSLSSHTIMVYALEGKLVHEFGGNSSQTFKEPWGICVDDNGLVYVVEVGNSRVLVF